MTSGTVVIWSLSRSDHGTRMPCSDWFGRSAAPVGTVSAMRHWKRFIKIPVSTDCYY